MTVIRTTAIAFVVATVALSIPTTAQAGPITVMVNGNTSTGGIDLSDGGRITLPFSGQLTSASVTVNTAGATSLPFGAFTANINGVQLGYAFRSPLASDWTIALDNAMLVAANQDGFVDIRLQFGGSYGALRFDSLQLNGEVTPAAVPEPGSLVLLGLGLLGLATAVRRRRRSLMA